MMHLASSCSLKQCLCRIGCATYVATTTCFAFDRVSGDRDAAQKSVGDPYGRALAATPNGLAGDWIDRTALAACWLDTSIAKTSVLARRAQLSDVARTSSLWSFARILSGDCSKMPRINVEDMSIACQRGNARRVRACPVGSITDPNIHKAA